MKEIISKDLLATVLKEVKGIEFERFQQNENYIGIEVIEGKYCHRTNYNIHLVAHICKEWAYKNGYELHSYSTYDKIRDIGYCSLKSLYTNTEFTDNSDTEPKAVFKACQWILYNKGK